ncbi:DUF3179 domain-containing protein [bacterium]|nr:DUF3179 domain-containing protein [bacterium]
MAVVNSRELDGTTLTLAASGWTYDDTFVLYDHETGTMWFPFEGQDGVRKFHGIAGEHAGRVLDPIPFSRALWHDWLEAHPQSALMLRP